MSEVRGRWEGWHVVDEGRVDLAIVSTDPSEPNAVFDAGAEVIIRPAAEDARVAVEDTIEIIRRFEATLEEKQGLQVDAGWALEVLVDVREALEDLRPDDAPKPNAEVVERARKWLSQGIRAADPAVDVGEQITEARILMDDLLACVEADARTPLPPEVLAKADDALKYNHENVGLNALRAIRPYLRADEVMTREEWTEKLREAISEAAQARDVSRSDIRLRLTDNATDFSATAESSEGVACNPDPAEAVRMYAALATCPHEDATHEYSEDDPGDPGWYSWTGRDGMTHEVRPDAPFPDCGELLPPAQATQTPGGRHDPPRGSAACCVGAGVH